MFSERLQKKLNQFEDTFGDCFSTIPLAMSHTEEEVIEMIDTCIREGKDEHEMGYLPPLDSDIMY